jgi:hypothetical protein
VSNRRLAARTVTGYQSGVPRCRHGNIVCSSCVVVEDAGRRMSETINGRITFYGPWELRSKWMVFRLSDGQSTNDIYDTKLQAVRHVSNELYYAFFTFARAMGGVSPRDAQIFLNMCRAAADSPHVRLSDPDHKTGGLDAFTSVDMHDQIMGRKRGNGPFWT